MVRALTSYEISIDGYESIVSYRLTWRDNIKIVLIMGRYCLMSGLPL
jgi:hypothetical protein